MNCANGCGTNIDKIARVSGKFCSHPCKSTFYAKMTKQKCKRCGAFHKKDRWVTYCSDKCKYKKGLK